MPKHPEDPFDEFLQSLNMGSISSQQHEMDIFEHLEYGINVFVKYEINHFEYGTNVYPQILNGNLLRWEQYIQNMNWKFGVEYGINIFTKT